MSDDAPSPEGLEREVRESTVCWQEGFRAWARHDSRSFAPFATFAGHVHGRGALTERERAPVVVGLNATATDPHEVDEGAVDPGVFRRRRRPGVGVAVQDHAPGTVLAPP